MAKKSIEEWLDDKYGATTEEPTATSTDIEAYLDSKYGSANEEKAETDARERLETSFAIDNMMLGFGRNKLNAIESAIPDDVENRAKVDSAYDYLTTKELRGVDDDSPLDITRGDGLTEWITKNYDSVTGKPAEATKSMVLPAGGTMGGTTFIKGNEEEAKAALRAYDNDFLGSRNKMAEAIVNNLPLADEDSDDEDLKAQGRVMLGDQVFNRAEAIQAARRLVSETMHPTLLRSNKVYRDNYFISTTGKNFEDFKLDKVSEWSSKLAELEKVLSADVKSMSSVPSLATGVSPQLAMAVKAEVDGLGALNKAREQIASLKDNDFFAGLDEGFDLVSMLTAGITTMGGNIKLNNVLDKVSEGKALTPSEKALYDVYGVQQEVEQMFGIKGRSGWNNIGLGVGGSAEVVLPMAAGMGAVRAIPGLATKALGTRTAYAAARQAFKKNTWRGLGEAIKQTAKVGGRTIANTGRATAGGLITAPFTPKMWSDFVEKRNEQYQLVDGKLEYTPTKAYKDLYGAIVDQTTEIASEIAGVGLSSFLRGGAKAFGRMLHLDDIADAMGIGLNTRSVFGWRKPNWWRVAEQNIGFSGALSEPLSEVWGDVMRNTMKAPFGMSDFAEMATADYWKTTFAVSAIYGGSLQLATVPARLAHIQQTMKLGSQAKRVLSHIENTALRNNLLSIINNNDYESAAQQMAQIPWNEYSRPDVGYAMDYIAAELPRQVGLGYIEEDMRLNAFRSKANHLADLRYKGVNGNEQTNLIVSVVTPDGVAYTVESGDYNNLDDGLLIVRDANGVKMPMAKNKIATVEKYDYTASLQNSYTQLYSPEVEEQRVQSVKDALAEMKEPTVEQVDLLMANNGFKEHSVGDIVALADGRTAEVLGRLPNGNYDLAITENGEATEYANAPFYDVLSDAPMTRDAQIASYMRENGERAEKPAEVAPAEAPTEEVAEEMPTVGGFSVGEVVNTPNGKARITAFGDNGEVMVDMNIENTSNNPTAMALVGLTLNDISREVAPAETTTDATTEQVSVGEQTADETPTEVESADTAPEIKSVPRLENGEVDYNAITDPDLYAEYFARDMGSKEAASAQMSKMVAATQSEVEKLAKKGDILVDANAVVANNKEIARLNERINLYNAVQMALVPAPQVETTATAEAPAEAQAEVASGVVPNELSEDIATEHLAVVDAMAKMLGVRITFVPEVRDSNGNLQNAKIVGKDIYIAAGATQIETISFLTGHEFTHRMKKLSPEQYAKLEDSVRNYLGDEAWEAEMATHTNTYRKVQRNITDEEIAEEVVADFIGRQVRDNNLFTQYLDSIKDKGLVDAIKSVLRAIRDFFRNINATAKDKALDEVISNLNTLIESASAKAEGAENTKEKFSLIGELDASYLDAVERGDMATAQRMVLEAAKLAMPNTKVVDENGNPKVVYHGTPNNFNTFSKEMFGTSTDRGIWGNGFYFSDSEQYAKTYEKRGNKQGKTLSVFLNIKRPLFISLRNGGNEGAMYFHELMEKHFTDDIYEDVTRTDELMSVAQERLTADIVANGYDGIVVEYTNHIDTEYVAFNPNQIKSADPVTYDDNGNVIPLSERFNPDKEDIRYSVRQPIFYSNAEYAVRGIKQEKATPEQWLKMIEKNGGLKAGEDKWLGLSDWLKTSDKKTLTKDEVLQYIAENDIQIEEVSYGDVADISREEIYESAEFAELRESLTEYDDDDNPYINRERYDELRSESYDFVDGFSLDYWGEELEVDSPAAAATYLGLTKADKEINETRLRYTTDGLTNKREIALVVPTIEPWNTSDNIHFGDAGEGRAVAWVRFGDAEAQRSEEVVRRVDEFDAPYKDVNGHDIYKAKDKLYKKDFISYGKLKSGEYAYVVYIDDKQIPVAHKSLEDARDAMNEYYKAHPAKRTRWDRVLVIDEIQSKRHQDGRDKGYISGDIKAGRAAAKARLREAYDAAQNYTETLKDKYNWGNIEANSFSERAQKFNALLTPEEIAERKRLDDEKRRADEEWEQYDSEIGAIPSAPFEKNWAELAMKRMLRYAAENGYDYVAWTTGDQQADRYDIGSVVKDIVTYDTKDADGNPIKKMKFRMNNMGTYNIATNMEGVIVKGDGEMKEGMRLSDITGKALAEKIMNGEGEDAMVFENGKDIEAKSLEGEELHIGNEGMKAFYDQMLPSFVRKYVKKWGATVGEVTMPDLEENNTMHSVDVTPAMRESVMQGQPKFSLRTMEELKGALDLYNKTSNIDNFVDTIKDISEGVGGNSYLQILVGAYEEDNDENWFAERINNIVGDFSGGYAPYTAGGVRYSLRGSDKSLVGLHNISLDKLRKAIKMGGLANPSVAVIDVDKATHEDYGDYTLVLTSNMVDARLGRNAGTWAGDAWTPTYPQIVKRIAMSKDITRFYKDINKMPEAMRNRVSLQLNSFLKDRPADSFAYWYLFEKGVAPEMAVIPPVFSDDIVKMVSEATDGTFNMWQKTDEQKSKCVDAYIAYKYDGDRAAYEADLQNRKERLQRALNTTKSQLVAKKAAGDLAALEEFGFDYDAVSTFLREVETDNSRRGQSDVQGTIRLAEDYIKDNNLEEDYQSWRDSLEGRYGVKEYIFDGYTESGNQRWLPHTTANASKWMKKQGREGATGTFPSFGLFVATVIPRMTTLSTIRKRKGHLGRPEQEYEAFKEKWENVYYELGQKLQPDAERFEDYGWWRLIEAVSTNNPKEHIKKQYGIELSAEDMQKLNDMLDAIKSNYPARYFETKFERPVELSEFIAAVVPNDIPADVEASLQDAYLNIYKYDKGVEGSRQEAVLEATDSPSVRFSMRDESFNIAISYLKGIAREYNIKQPIFIAQSADEYVAMMRDAGVKDPESKREVGGTYIPRLDVIGINGEKYSNTKELFGALMHERTHAITDTLKEKLNALLDTLNKDDVLAVRDILLSEHYKKHSPYRVLNELISIFVGEIERQKLRTIFRGGYSIEKLMEDAETDFIGRGDVVGDVYHALIPIIKENLEIQKQLYNGERENHIVLGRGVFKESNNALQEQNYSRGYNRRGNRPLESQSRVLGGDREIEGSAEYRGAEVERYSAREQEQPFGSMRAREEAIAMAERGDYASDIYRKTGWYFDEKHNEWRGNTRLHNDRYIEMRSKEEKTMPFFEDGGDETYIWGDISEEIVESATYKSSEERILAHMKNRHLVARERIRQAAKEDIDNTRRIYNEANLKRNEGLGKRTTNAGKVAYILGDTTPESLSLYDQALVKIALDEVHISWDDIGNKRGLASELGLKTGEKRSYSNITKGATKGLEEFVHGWWQELGGYEKDIDTQDLRNALIEVLGEVNRPTQALAALRQKFDTALAERDAVINRLEFDMEQALLAEDERYNNEVEGFKTSEDKRQRISDYERDVVFFDEAEALGGTLRSVEKKLADIIARSQAKENELKAKHALKRAELRSDAEVARRGLAKYRRSYEEYKELADAINEAKAQIRDVVNNTEVLQFRRREINRLINTLDNARSINDLEYISRRLESLLLDISIRQNRENLNRLLNLRLPNGQYVEAWVNNQIASGAITTAEGKRILTDMWRGTNNKGIRVARYVDGETSAILNYLRNELITPNSRRFYVEEKDAEGNVILDENGKPKKTLTADKELELVVNREIKKAQERIDDITAYFEGNKNKEEVVEKSVPREIEREALSRYITYLRIVDAKQDIEEAHNALAESDFILADDGNTEEQKKEARTIRKAAFEQLNTAKENYNAFISEFNNDLSELLANGRDAYKAFRDAQEAHRKEIINEAVNAIGGRSYLKHPAPTVMQNIRARAIRGGINNAYYSFQMVLKEIDRYAPNGEGNFYKRYMYGAQSAQDNFIAMQNTHFVQIADKVNELWKEEFKNSNPYVAFKALSDAMSTYRVGTVVYKPFIDKDGEAHDREEWPLVVPNAMFLLAMWQQPRYAMAMAKHGITEEYMLELKDAISSIDHRLIMFMDWVRDELLPNTRLEYNAVYREIFGIDMDMEANYFPAKVIGFYKEEKVEQHEPEVKSSEATGIIARTSRGLIPDPSINYFSILAEHLQKMDQWASFQKLNNDINTLTSNNEFKGRMATLMPGYNDAVNGHGGLVWLWKRTSAIMLNQYKPQENGVDAVFKILQRGWAASNIAWRFMTALKQLASMPVFAVYSLDPECAKLFMQELGFVTSMIVRGRGKELFQAMADEYPTFRKRWTERNAGMEWLTRNISPNRNMVDLRKANKYNLVATAEALDKAFNKLAIEWGMAPNALVDALSVIVGLRTVQAFEEYRISKDKGRLTYEDIELAKVKAAIAINETQQSAEGAYLSVIQMQRSAISAPFVTYLNNTFANHRKRLAGATELYRQYFDKDWLKEMENRYGDNLPAVRRQAQMKALADIGQGLISDFNFQLLTAAGVIIPMMLNGDDEEEAWYEVGLDAFVAFLSNVAMGGFVGGNIATGLLSGYTPTLMPSAEEFGRDIKKLQSNWKDKRYGEFAYLGLNIAAKNGVGVDLDTFLNMLEGIKAIFDGEGMLGVMKLLNTPQSQIDLIAGAKREGETVMEYVTRRMRLEAIFATSYNDAFNEDRKLINRPFGVSTYMLRQLHKDYETAYRRQVVIREEGRSGWNDMLKIDEEYKDVVEAIGWTAEKKPNNKAFESGEYEAPVEGMTRKQYDEAAKLEEKIASRARKIESFVGTDEEYYSLVKEMTEYKKQLIDNYNELE